MLQHRHEVSVKFELDSDNRLPGRAVAVSLDSSKQRQRSLPKSNRVPARSPEMPRHEGQPSSPHEIQAEVGGPTKLLLSCRKARPTGDVGHQAAHLDFSWLVGPASAGGRGYWYSQEQRHHAVHNPQTGYPLGFRELDVKAIPQWLVLSHPVLSLH